MAVGGAFGSAAGTGVGPPAVPLAPHLGPAVPPSRSTGGVSGRRRETMDGDDISKGAVRWALIPAGGRGVRLRPLTRRIADDDRPKQFCVPSVAGESRKER